MKINTFRAFSSRNYRLFFIGQSISLMGTWMQKTAVSWVIYSLTHSKFMLGVSLFATMFPSFLFSFLGGAVSDRYNRYKVLLLTQIISMLQAILLTLLVYFGHDIVWGVLALSAMLGIVNAFDVPARQSLVAQMVNNEEDLPNALALNSSMVNLSRLIGPGIAGIAIEALGDDVCFGLNALSFLAVIISLLMMRLPQHKAPARSKNIFTDMREGFRYLKQTPSVAFVIEMLGLMSLFELPFNTLIPAYAKDIFHGTASTFGIIDSIIGLGAFSGALYLASLRPGADLRVVLAVNTFILGLGLVLFSHTTIYPLALAFAVLCGFGMMSQITVCNTLVQTTVPPAMRGRVISFYAMAFFGMQPIGGLIVGSVSQHIGVENTVLAEGIIAVVAGGLHLRFLRKSKLAEKDKQRLEEQPMEATIPV